MIYITNCKGFTCDLTPNTKTYFKYDAYLSDKIVKYIDLSFGGAFYVQEHSDSIYSDALLKNVFLTLVSNKGEILFNRVNCYSLNGLKHKTHKTKYLINSAIDLTKSFIEFVPTEVIYYPIEYFKKFYISFFWCEKERVKKSEIQNIELIETRPIAANQQKTLFAYNQKLNNRVLKNIFLNYELIPLKTLINPTPPPESLTAFKYIDIVLFNNEGQEIINVPIWTFAISYKTIIHQFYGNCIDWEKSYIYFHNMENTIELDGKKIELNFTFENL